MHAGYKMWGFQIHYYISSFKPFKTCPVHDCA